MGGGLETDRLTERDMQIKTARHLERERGSGGEGGSGVGWGDIA